MTGTTAVDRSSTAHRARWGEPELVSRAPGRVNLIGEHTDYNDGFALPMALPFATAIAASWSGDEADGAVCIVSEGFGEVSLDPSGDPTAIEPWAQHLAGVVSLLRDQDVPSGGWRATIASDIPSGAGLSSSAAIEVAAISLLTARAGRLWPPLDAALLAQRVENEIIGLPSGIMDQYVSAGAVAGCASLLDCRALTLTPVPLPDEVVVAVLDSGTRRRLTDGAYADRRAACERAAAALGVPALRDASRDQLDHIVDPIDRRRARHVIEENQRVADAADALRVGDVFAAGKLLTASHASLRDLYEVSGPGLDAIVETALAAPGCLGARMTGGGFAGCAVALVETEHAEHFADRVTDRYTHDGHTARAWLCRASAGASIVRGEARVSDG